jgi:Ca-activated chloride channel family protein
MNTWELRDPALILFALLAPLVYWWAARAPAVLGFSSLRLVAGAPISWRARFSKLPALLMAVATILLAVALARPRSPDAETRVFREGIAIVMAIDRSGSMNARDLVPTDISIDRLTVVKRVFQQFVLGDGSQSGTGRADDMIGLVAFARYADSVCPLTMDHGNLVSVVNDLDLVTERAEDGTAIGDGLALAVERLRRNKAKSKVVILLTDGVNNAGMVDPTNAAGLAVDHDIKVYCIGAGTDGFAPVPVANPFTGRSSVRRMPVEIDETLLRKIAEQTGGQYFRATEMSNLAEIYGEIDRLERTEITEVRYLQYHEHFAPLLAGACGLIGIAVVAGGTVLRRLP